MSKMEGKTIFSRHRKQFDGLTWLTPNPYILLHIYVIVALLPWGNY